MKISGNKQNPMTKEADVGKAVTDNKKKLDSAKTGSKPSSAENNISVTTAEKIKEALAGAPEVNQSRIDAIKAMMKNGTFEINPEKIADGMLKEINEHRASNTK